MKNKVPVVFTFDSHELLSASVAIQSLLDCKNDDTYYDIFVLCDSSITQKMKDKFAKIAKITWLEVDKTVFKDCPIKESWPEAVYYRLLIPDYIKEYDRVIYSDTDVFFKGDLSSLYNSQDDDCDWAGVIAEINSPDIECHTYYPENKNEFVYMSGFMVMNLKKMRDENKVSEFFKTIELYKDRLKMFDLEVLNLTCDKISPVPFRYCVLVKLYETDDIKTAPEYEWLTKHYTHEYLEEEKKNVVIVHYAGEMPKIWNRSVPDISKYYLAYILKSPFINVFYKHCVKDFCQRLFSIKNTYSDGKKHKVLYLLGIKIRIK